MQIYVWNISNMKNIVDYYDLYVLRDTFVLAHMFENFRDVYLKSYNLDPAHLYSGPEHLYIYANDI